MRVADEFSLIFESEVIKSRLVRDANAASISDYVPSPPLPHSSFPSPCSFFFLPPPCTRAFLFFLSLSRIWFTGFLSDADTPQRSVSCFPKGSTRNDKNSKKSDASNRLLSIGNEAKSSRADENFGPSNFLPQLANSK